MTRIYISDTNIWIDLRNADLLVELFRLPVKLCCTDFVMNELTDLPRHLLIERGLQVETLNEDDVTRLVTLMGTHGNSSLADVSCYYLARQTGRPLLTGDGKLRRQATRDGIEVFGVLWLLDQLVDQTLISPARAGEALRAMLRHGARLPQTECHDRLQRWQ